VFACRARPHGGHNWQGAEALAKLLLDFKLNPKELLPVLEAFGVKHISVRAAAAPCSVNWAGCARMPEVANIVWSGAKGVRLV
jgi:hypothetical protein